MKAIEKKPPELWRMLCIPEGMKPRVTIPLAAVIWVVFTVLSVDWAAAAR